MRSANSTRILPPPVTPSDEEPIAAGGRQPGCGTIEASNEIESNLPPPVTPSDEQPIATGGRRCSRNQAERDSDQPDRLEWRSNCNIEG